MYVCSGCGATVTFTIEGAKESTPSEKAQAMAGSLRCALDGIQNADEASIYKIKSVIEQLEKRDWSEGSTPQESGQTGERL